jgi:hypothetical protein
MDIVPLSLPITAWVTAEGDGPGPLWSPGTMEIDRGRHVKPREIAQTSDLLTKR